MMDYPTMCLVCDNEECPGAEDPECCPMAEQMIEGHYDETMSDDQRDRAEESYSEHLMHGGDQ